MDLRSILRGKVVIVGIGNIMKGDDAFGPALLDRLAGKVKAVLINAGVSPENYTGKIAKEKPDCILLVDAADLGRKPGEWAILKRDEILKSGFTTHDMSPAIFIDYMKERTGADIYLLGVQPKNISFGDKMSHDVSKTLEAISELIKSEVKNA